MFPDRAGANEADRKCKVLMANCISKVSEKNAEKRKARARRFMEKFGCHVPAGVQTLGGVFFSIADAESEGVQKTTTDLNLNSCMYLNYFLVC